MRKLSLLLAIALVVVCALAGCGGSAPASSAAPAAPASSAAPVAPASSTAPAAPASSAAPAESAAPAVDFPTKPITIVVPNATGGGSDLTARVVAQFANKYLGQTMIVENREGGGQTVAHTYFKSVANDGYTMIIYGNSGTTVAPYLQKTEYDPLLDEEPICRVTNLRNVLVVSADAPYKTLDEFVEYCKANQGVKLSTSGANGIDDLTARMMNLRYGTGIIPVAYDSGSEAALAVLSGECEVSCTSLTAALPQITEGNLTALCFVCDSGDPAYPDIKTAIELGYDVALNNSIGLAVPAGTDPARKAILEKYVGDLQTDPDFIKAMSDIGMVRDYLNAADMLELTKTDSQAVQDIIAAGA